MSSDKKSQLKISGKQVPDELIKLTNEAFDDLGSFIAKINKIYEKGADIGFSREEISKQIIRPIARQRGFNKDRIYYLTHTPERKEQSKQRYQKLLEESRNITTSGTEIDTSAKPEPQPEPKPKPQEQGIESQKKERLYRVVPVESCREYDIEKYDSPLLREWVKKLLKDVKDNEDYRRYVADLVPFVKMIHEMLLTDKKLLGIIVSKIAVEVQRQDSKNYRAKDDDKMTGLEKIASNIVLNKRLSPTVNKAFGGSGEQQSDEHYIVWIGLDSPNQTAA